MFDPAAFRISAYRAWVIGGVAGAIALLALGWFLLIRPELTESAQFRDQTAAAQDDMAALRTRLAEVRAQNDDLAEYRTAYATARRALPSTDAVSTLLRDTQSVAVGTRTDLRGMTIGTASALSTAGVYELPITVTVAGAPAALDDFVQRMQRVQPRTVLMRTLSLASDSDSPTMSTGVLLTIELQAFVAPAPALTSN